MGIADGTMQVDGKTIYEAKDLRVGLFTARRHWLKRAQLPMRRVVVTGLGIVSASATTPHEVLASLQGAPPASSSAENTRNSASAAMCTAPSRSISTTRSTAAQRRFMGDGAAYTYLAMQQAIADAGLEESDVSNERTGLIVGSGGASTPTSSKPPTSLREQGRASASAPSWCRAPCRAPPRPPATPFKIKGVNYSISLGLRDLAHCIGNAGELIQLGKQDIVFAGGGEELHWTLTVLFDAMGRCPRNYNDTPTKASRAYDTNRDGFVISGGGGIVVLEELEHAKARGAKIYAELVGYGATSDGYDMVRPRAKARCAACGRRWQARRRRRSTTSTPMAPRRRSATSRS